MLDDNFQRYLQKKTGFIPQPPPPQIAPRPPQRDPEKEIEMDQTVHKVPPKGKSPTANDKVMSWNDSATTSKNI